ncbi:MAG TPA: FHA domain-containing protein, partial [Tepidisphaeraceae bacterium]|nr:FHA domain-containing protein [Tepidisphaeraceae bacterium]
GVASGILEAAVKSGWLKVTAGLIAGKQFVLYRNPTYIGAHPSCHIFLWKDAQVGKRHAALHLVGGGIELENLPLGAGTMVNGKPIQRMRLRNGDRIQVGRTTFEFHEKQRTR